MKTRLPDIETALDLLSLEAEGDDDDDLAKQLPPEQPPVMWDMSQNGLVEGGDYSSEPPALRTIPLVLEKYPTLEHAKARAAELAAARGETVYRVFRTARAFVAQVYRAAKPGEGYR